MAQDASKSKKPAYDTDPHPYVPIQLNAAKTQRLTDEDCLKLIQEGKCFYCKEDGHLYRDCKKRPNVMPQWVYYLLL